MDPITGKVQNYAWGSPTSIPEFLGVAPDGRPQAELWLGAHPLAPAEVGGSSLLDRIAADPAGVVGPGPVQAFGPRLPYLVKVLAAAQPLSLQAHPSRAGAEVGFAREEASGLDRAAPNRLYRDDWPKPEMIVALEPFDALCGFAEPAATYELFEQLGVASALALVEPLRAGGPAELAAVFGRVMRLGPDEIGVIDEVVAASATLQADDAAGPELAKFARTAVELATFYPGDPGVVAALLMNRMTLQRFEGLFLPAGNLHAYLRGTGIEIMANSDNVMRGGLTPKHVDVDELLAVLDFTPLAPAPVPLVGAGAGVWRYDTAAPEFALWRVDLNGSPVDLPAVDSGRVVLVVAGSIEIAGADSVQQLGRGEAVFGYAGETLTATGTGTLVIGSPGD